MLGTLRRFGLQHHDLPTMLWNVATVLRVLALDVDSRNEKPTPVILYISSAIIMVLYLYVYHFSSYWLVFWRGGVDILISILLLALSISSGIGVAKQLYMYSNRKQVKKLVSEYLECDAALTPNSRMSKNVHATLRNVKKRAIIFWLVIVGNGVVYFITPLLTPGRHLVLDEQILFGLEPMFESPNFEIAFIILFFGIFEIVYPAASISGFVIIIVGYTEAHMLALSQELIHLWDDAQCHYKLQTHGHLRSDVSPSCSNHTVPEPEINRKQAIIVNDYIRRRLVSIIKSHATNINLIKQVENVFRTAIAIEFTLLSSGLILELLGGLENTFIAIPFCLVQVSMDCFTGQRLLDANKTFEDAVYACKWENFDVSNRKLVLLMLQNAQKTVKLSAGGLATLSYMSLMSVYKGIYSAYTALRSTMHKSK